MGGIKFGTDGWRAVISDDFTFENVKLVAQAIADYLVKDGGAIPAPVKKIAVGYDTRFLSEKYAEIVACVIASNGIPVVLSDRPTPTPSVSFAIKDRGFMGGVMITASHNPPQYNGIKFKAYYGGSAGPEVTKKFEEYLGKGALRLETLEALKAKELITLENILPAHLAFVKRYAKMAVIKKTRLKILVDSMYGTGSTYLAGLLKGGNCSVETIHSEYNPGFGGTAPEPKLPNLNELSAKTKAGKYDIGIATDGDSDRLGIALPNGKLLTGHKVMTLLLLHLIEDRKMTGGVVQTQCGTYLINKICRKYGRKMYETAVGFKYIGEIMIKEDVVVGGEETGGVAFKGYIPERDGFLSALLILEMMAMRKKKLLDIIASVDKEYGTYEYKRLDVKLPDDKKKKLMNMLKTSPFREINGKKVVETNTLDGYKFILEDSSWFMLRLSGTEPILRVYSEASSEKKALELIDFGRKLALGL